MRGGLVCAVFFVAMQAAASFAQEFAGGETLDFDLSWINITGGAARMTAAPVDEERIRLTSIGRSGRFFSRFFKVRDEIESLVARSDFSTLRYRKVLDEGGDRADEVTAVENGVAVRKGKSVNVPRPVFDPLSLIYHIRTLDLDPGKSHEFKVIADGKLYTLRATALRRETVSTPAGTFSTIVVEPKMESEAGIFRDEQRRLLIWYSDDRRHLPVRVRSEVKIGAITATLRSYRHGADNPEPVTRSDQ